MSNRTLMLGTYGALVGVGIWGLCALWSHYGPSRVPANWSFATPNPKIYRTGYDKVAGSQTPRSLVIRSLNSSAKGDAGLSQKCDATPYRGQRVRISVWIKTDGVNGADALYVVVKDQAGIMLAQGGYFVNGSRYWRQYAAVVDVPEDAASLFYGMTLHGAGKAWFNDLQINVVPNTVKLQQWQVPDFSAVPKFKPGSLLAVCDGGSLEESEAEGRFLKSDLMDGKPFRVSSRTIAEDYAGKKLRLRARLKTADLQGGTVAIYFNSLSQGTDDYFTGWSEPISGTTEWKDYDCAIPISGQKAMVTAGIYARGKAGSVFLKSLELSLADDSPPGGEGFEVMQWTWPESPVLATPMNLDFSK